MIIIDKKKPISALKLINSTNHTHTNRFCDINNEHVNFISRLNYTIGERIYNLKAGLYAIEFNNNRYIIHIYFDLVNGDFLVIKNQYNITIYMAGSNPYHIIPYKINSDKDITSEHNIESINDNLDIIVASGETTFTGTPSINNPVDISRLSSINLSTSSSSNNDSINIPLKYTLGKLANGARDYIIINTDQLIASNIINTSREVLSGGLNWQYKQEYSNSNYYVFFAKYNNVKLNNDRNAIRCSHFYSESCTSLLDKNTTNNLIATSYGEYGNGIWIKISSSELEIYNDEDIGRRMKKWITNKDTSDNPIYIEYEISKTIHDIILIDEYHIKTWYPNTKININNNCKISIFYKALKSI